MAWAPLGHDRNAKLPGAPRSARREREREEESAVSKHLMRVVAAAAAMWREGAREGEGETSDRVIVSVMMFPTTGGALSETVR